MSLEKFRYQFPVGTPVKYYPIPGMDRFHTTEITSDPWVVEGAGVVKVAGFISGVSISQIKRAD